MAVELFGPAVGPYAAVACVISFLMTGHRSVYPSQVLSITKSPSIKVATGGEMKDIPDLDYQFRKRSISGGIVKGYDKAMKGYDIARKGLKKNIKSNSDKKNGH